MKKQDQICEDSVQTELYEVKAKGWEILKYLSHPVRRLKCPFYI